MDSSDGQLAGKNSEPLRHDSAGTEKRELEERVEPQHVMEPSDEAKRKEWEDLERLLGPTTRGPQAGVEPQQDNREGVRASGHVFSGAERLSRPDPLRSAGDAFWKSQPRVAIVNLLGGQLADKNRATEGESLPLPSVPDQLDLKPPLSPKISGALLRSGDLPVDPPVTKSVQP